MVRWIWPLVLALLLVAAPAAAEGGQSVIARQAGVAFTAGDRFVRLADVPLAAGGAPVTHAHPPGFAYAVVEPHALTIAARRTLLSPGQAGWVGNQEEHTHARGSDAAGRFYFVGVFPAAARGVIPPGVAPTRTLDSETFPVAAGTYDVLLTEARLPAAGDTATLPVQNGPAGLVLIEGQATLGGRALPAEGVVVLRAGEAAALTSAAGGARVLALALVPASAPAPTQLPRTGSPGPALPLALGAALAGLGWLARRRARSSRRHPGRAAPAAASPDPPARRSGT
jgi:LPXTG-motif cell wall-anchored protein